MKPKKMFSGLLFGLSIGLLVFITGFSDAREPADIFTLEETIDLALTANIDLKSSREATNAAMAVKKGQRTTFLPTFNTSYRYLRNDEPASIIGILATGSKNEYRLNSKFTQPLFTGFALLNQYRIASLGLDVSMVSEKLLRQDIIFEAKKTFFELLKARKLMAIAKETVTQISAQSEVAKNYYQVGMTPLNDFLQAQVELANAEQQLIVAKNNLATAESNFNILLRRQINSPVEVKDILDYTSFEYDLDHCLSEAEKTRLEIEITELEIEIAGKELKLAKKDYFPAVNLEGNYFFNGNDWDVDGGPGIYDPEGWNIAAVASWNFWEWGKTTYGVKEKLSRLSQAQFQKTQLLDNIHLQVKNAYQRTQEAEKAIITVEKAIEQAKENFRINEERYKEQMATSTDVLDAQTLLSRTMTNYYNALYEFKISKASLFRAMGQEVMQ